MMILAYMRTDYKENLSEKDKCFFREVIKNAYIVDFIKFSHFQKNKKIILDNREEKSKRRHYVTLSIVFTKRFLLFFSFQCTTYLPLQMPLLMQR